MLFQRAKSLSVALSILILLQVSCSQEDGLTKKLSTFDPYNYIVHSGDTLYSIAWRYDLDYRDIARWNNIITPYLIKPADVLKLRGPLPDNKDKNYLFGQAEESVKEERETDATDAIPDYSNPENIPPAPPIAGKYPVPPVASTDKSRKNRVPVYHSRKTGKVKVSERVPVAAKTNRNTQIKKQGSIHWSWPVSGKVISVFSATDNSRKGIDISASSGEKVKAAADGTVVYSGAGLVSYGNLIIVKHNDRYLSAYAYNKSLLVKEGTRVKRGQIIAIIGKSAKVTNLLHFEIRKDGKPVNPLIYLPKT